MLQKAGQDKLSEPEALIYGAGILGGGSLGWLLSAATNSAEKHKKRRLWYALAGAAAGGAGAHAFLQSEHPVPLNGEKVSRAEFYRAGANGNRYRLKEDPDSVYTETQKAYKLTTPPREAKEVQKYPRWVGSGLLGAGAYKTADSLQKGNARDVIFRALDLNGPHDANAPTRVRFANLALDKAVDATTPKSFLGKVKQVVQHARRNYNDLKQISWETPGAKLSKARDILKDPPDVREARLKFAENILSKNQEATNAFTVKIENGGAPVKVEPDLGALYDMRQSGSRPVVSRAKDQRIKIATHKIRGNSGGRVGTAVKAAGKGLIGLLTDFAVNKIGAHFFPNSVDFPGYTDDDFELIQE